MLPPVEPRFDAVDCLRDLHAQLDALLPDDRREPRADAEQEREEGNYDHARAGCTRDPKALQLVDAGCHGEAEEDAEKCREYQRIRVP